MSQGAHASGLAPLGPAEASPSAPRLLIVDDIAENRAILTRRFQRRGFHVTEADGGREALRLAGEQQFDAVLLDVMMPDIDGIGVLRRLRQSHTLASLPIIMVTAKIQSTDIVEALELGANDYVTKPVDFPVALARVNAQVERKRAEEAAQSANQVLRETLESKVEERTRDLVRVNQDLTKEISQRQRSEDRIRYLAHHDALTGLGNRVLFHEQLTEALARLAGTPETLALLFLDLDGFKSVNDTLGHAIGDALLRQVADRLRDALEGQGAIARLGGDEFAVLHLAKEHPGSAAALAERLIGLFGEPFSIDGRELLIGTSCGIAVAPGDTADAGELLKMADLAMYRAKAAGRGNYRFFEPGMDAHVQARRAIEVEMRGALVQNAFKLFYQPLVNLATNRLTGFEALLRWNHPERGAIPPAEFIPVAEETGLIAPLGAWALREACAEAATWPGNIRVAVNLSPIQFRNRDLVSIVVNALASSGLAPDRLELEVTESVLLETSDQTYDLLRQLRALGVRISLDDFGTGYSSLGYLKNFQFDKIKIDRSFVRGLDSDASGRIIVRAIAGLGLSFGMTTTAEGVETEDQLKAVRIEGCDEVQGYFFSAPCPSHEVQALIARFSQGADHRVPRLACDERLVPDTGDRSDIGRSDRIIALAFERSPDGRAAAPLVLSGARRGGGRG